MHTLSFRIVPLLLIGVLAGCSAAQKETPQERSEAAKALFERASKTFHIPSAQAKGPEKTSLENQALAVYKQLFEKYPDQDYWAAQALRSLGNIHAAQGNIDLAVKDYAAVDKKFPQQHWEVLMAWKSAADLLWESGQKDRAKSFYQQIVSRYDVPAAPQVEKTIVRGSRMRLTGADLPSEN